MKTYEVTFEFRQNCRFGWGVAYSCVVAADNKKSAGEFAYELYIHSTGTPFSREMFKATIERI